MIRQPEAKERKRDGKKTPPTIARGLFGCRLSAAAPAAVVNDEDANLAGEAA